MQTVGEQGDRVTPKEKVGKEEAEPLDRDTQVIAKGRLHGAGLVAGSTGPGAWLWGLSNINGCVEQVKRLLLGWALCPHSLSSLTLPKHFGLQVCPSASGTGLPHLRPCHPDLLLLWTDTPSPPGAGPPVHLHLPDLACSG